MQNFSGRAEKKKKNEVDVPPFKGVLRVSGLDVGRPVYFVRLGHISTGSHLERKGSEDRRHHKLFGDQGKRRR